MLLPDRSADSPFSLSASVLEDILRHAKPLGHYEDRGTLNIGFGFVYYGLARVLRPQHVLVIGSGYGFSVVCLALALRDNGIGRLTFVDPSFSIFRHGPFHTVGGQSNWDDAAKVRAHFARFGVEDIVTHHRITSAEFFEQYEARALPPLDVAFIDGNHAYAHVAHDFAEVAVRSRKNSYILLHDTNIYVREFMRHAGVKRWLRHVARHEECFEVVDFPFSSGVALVRVLRDDAWPPPA
jgi:predicted O-methyltransferase YrrM